MAHYKETQQLGSNICHLSNRKLHQMNTLMKVYFYFITSLHTRCHTVTEGRTGGCGHVVLGLGTAAPLHLVIIYWEAQCTCLEAVWRVLCALDSYCMGETVQSPHLRPLSPQRYSLLPLLYLLKMKCTAASYPWHLLVDVNPVARKVQCLNMSNVANQHF